MKYRTGWKKIRSKGPRPYIVFEGNYYTKKAKSNFPNLKELKSSFPKIKKW